MENKPLAIATVPPQTWGPLYEEKEALCCGTIFQQLDLPFFAAEGHSCHLGQARPLSQEQARREELMSQISAASFFLDDLTLFLDTHPKEEEALRLYQEKKDLRQKLLAEFCQDFYPLTKDSLTGGQVCHSFCWQEGPAPWEGACV
ncbi:MAG: spore coat protein CotJB [Eubacteriales bacterium]|nr:spore coat protein CotJB [Eubacteriales bacterium]